MNVEPMDKWFYGLKSKKGILADYCGNNIFLQQKQPVWSVLKFRCFLEECTIIVDQF